MYSICKAPSHFFPLVILIPLMSWRNFVCSCLNDVTRTITHTIQKVLFNVYHFHVQICDHFGQDDSTTAWLVQSPAATSVSSHNTLEAPITRRNKVLHHTLEAPITSNKVFIIHRKLRGSSISHTSSFYICKASAMNL
jgi:hypothetical protein